MKLSEIIRLADESLTSETWARCYCFASAENSIRFSSHGAVQRIVNPKVREAFDLAKTIASHDMVKIVSKITSYVSVESISTATLTASSAFKQAVVKSKENLLTKINLYLNRPSWVKSTNEYGNLDVHYCMGLCDLNFRFENSDKTSFLDVKEKLFQTYQLALLIDKTESFT